MELQVRQSRLLFTVLTVLTLFSNFAFAGLCKKALAPVYEATQLLGKRALVTGATFGIGKETALGLAKQGAEVIIVGRDQVKAIEAVEWIKRESGNPKVTYLLADLSNLQQVKKLATDFKSQYSELDILVNNAGAIFAKKEMTSENLEKTWALNHLSPMLLTLELLPALKSAPKARVVNVASALYEKGNVSFTKTKSDESFKGLQVYSDSKLASMLTAFYLAKQLNGTHVQINCLHPGFVDTGIGANNGGLLKYLLLAAKPLKKFLAEHTDYMMTPEEGARTSIYLASSSEVEGVTGQYFYKSQGIATTATVQDQELQNKIWDLSLKQIQEALKESSK